MRDHLNAYRIPCSAVVTAAVNWAEKRRAGFASDATVCAEPPNQQGGSR